jgi:parallel beta-helix repeat protein/predicted outer membrane repeat protein
MDPFCAIQPCIDAAFDGDTCLVADGVYTGIDNRNVDFDGRLITLQSENGPVACIIDCQSAGRAFLFNSGETAAAVVDGFTIRNGSSGSSGAVYLSNSSPTITDCVFSQNAATNGNGGAIGGSFNSAPVITGCTFSENTATNGRGGGVYFTQDSDPTITDCTFTGNEAIGVNNFTGSGGGAAFYDGSHAVITNCQFNDNSATGPFNATIGYGGGLWIRESHPTIRDCTFTNNFASFSSGAMFIRASNAEVTNSHFIWNTSISNSGAMAIFVGGSPQIVGCTFRENSTLGGAGALLATVNISPRITNCLFAGNEASTFGGAVACGAYDAQGSNNQAFFRNCTIVGNTAPIGGGIYSTETGDAQTTIFLQNSILWGNSPDQAVQQSGAVTTVGYSDVQGGWAGSHNIALAPAFMDPDGPDGDPTTYLDNDYHLSPISPCIDAADNNLVPADELDLDDDGNTTEPIPLDIEGNSRFFDVAAVVDTGNAGTSGLPVVDMGTYERNINDCNINDIPDEEDIAEGTSDDINGNGLPDECEPAFVAAVVAEGCRYLAVTIPFDAEVVLALELSSPEFPCLQKYVGADGSVVDAPVFQSVADWETVYVHGDAVVPEASYEIRVDFGAGQLGEPVAAQTWVWGDVDNNALANVADIQLIVLGFQGDFSNASLYATDIAPCVPNELANLADALNGVVAFQGGSFQDQCVEPCP